ncbi:MULTISPECIES: MATE family efflux transporter [Shouchella]|nr:MULTISPECIES: MATE family efflux transporter [Bacillaceae]KQL59172.1 MATE family efflux transporter [Alkalicoccobacillus plakortidis]MBG9782733.1 multidrug transporter MatE [Shouchella lehensis]RQW21969.1 MATE family efflux transporter [Bacillus sp. C1-1]TES47811.1 MATE family efflux transporter [Shouchella lehensis]
MANPLETEKISKLFMRYLIPSLVGMLLMAINLAVDGIMVGNRLGPVALAGVNIAGPVYTIFVGLSLWLGIGGATLYSQAMGRKEEGRARVIFTHSILLIGLGTIVIGALALLFHEPLVYALGANEETAPFAAAYMNVFLVFGFIFTLENASSIFVRNDGNPTLAMAALVTTAFSNVGINYIILYVLDLGVREIAFGTIIAAFLGLLVLSSHFFTKRSNLKFVRVRFDSLLSKQALRFGFPSFLAEVGISVFTVSHNIMFARLAGTVGVAAFSVVNYVHAVMLLMFLGMGAAVQPIVSYFHGAAEHEKKRQLMKLAIRTGFVAGFICFLVGQFAAVPIVNIFGDFPQEVKELAVRGIRLFFIAYLVMGVNFVLMTYFQSIGEVAIATWITAGRQIILMLLFLLTVPFLLGVHAIWLAIPFAEITVLVLIYVYLKRSNIHFGEKRVF